MKEKLKKLIVRGFFALWVIIGIKSIVPVFWTKADEQEVRIKQPTPSSHYDEVYVCTGKYSKRFHSDEDCRGLQSCRGEIITMSIEEAEDYGLTPCGYCY